MLLEFLGKRIGQQDEFLGGANTLAWRNLVAAVYETANQLGPTAIIVTQRDTGAWTQNPVLLGHLLALAVIAGNEHGVQPTLSPLGPAHIHGAFARLLWQPMILLPLSCVVQSVAHVRGQLRE